jgi:hypothetical protein
MVRSYKEDKARKTAKAARKHSSSINRFLAPSGDTPAPALNAPTPDDDAAEENNGGDVGDNNVNDLQGRAENNAINNNVGANAQGDVSVVLEVEEQDVSL